MGHNFFKKDYLYLLIWIIVISFIGFSFGSLTKPQINNWYLTLQRSPLTPPNYIFGVVWSILYFFLSIFGWIIFNAKIYNKKNLLIIKILYIVQLLLNFSWTPIFFYYHLIDYSFIILIIMDAMVFLIILISLLNKLRFLYLLMIPYFIWICFATYLTYYLL